MSTAVTEYAWDIVIPHHARGARMVRQRITASLTGHLHPEDVVDVAAVASELVGNAVCHAAPLQGNVIRVSWSVLDGGAVEVRVEDGGSGATPRVRHVGPEAVAGRGLTIVEALAERWGADEVLAGRCVWARIRLRDLCPRESRPLAVS